MTSGVFGPLTQITGTISSTTDRDMFEIFITGGGTFSATTVGTPGTVFDTQRYLFDSTGKGVYANDDDIAGAGAKVRHVPRSRHLTLFDPTHPWPVFPDD